MTTIKNVWNNPSEMHAILETESKEYFNGPEPKEIKEVQLDGSVKTYYEMPPSQFAIDAILNESRINRLNGGSNNVSF
tara:strand:- start:167 stop:400 length:234 start_codon:yes stop_codon:yes gene_type:complete